MTDFTFQFVVTFKGEIEIEPNVEKHQNTPSSVKEYQNEGEKIIRTLMDKGLIPSKDRYLEGFVEICEGVVYYNYSETKDVPIEEISIEELF